MRLNKMNGNLKEVVLEKDESVTIITPYGELRLVVFERDQRGNKECININTAFEEMYLKSTASNDLSLFITKKDPLTQKRVKSYYENEK